MYFRKFFAAGLSLVALVAASAVQAGTQLPKGREFTQILVDSSGTRTVFHLVELDAFLSDGKPHNIKSEAGDDAIVQLVAATLVVSLHGSEYRLPMALLPRKKAIHDLPPGVDVETPGREYRISFKRADGTEDVVHVQRSFVDAID